ncbi:MAG: oligosaccharide flippase family protein [Deltaproteobacteria bacterium]|nr:oligosaccharide flippase family protein [Deltaproteobacteria bacterium]
MLSDRFLRAGTWFFAASMVTNVFNYVFQLTMGRLLSTPDFGLMNSLFSLLLITSLPFITIMTVLTKYVSTFAVEGDYGRIKSLFLKAYKNIFGIASILLAAFVCLSFLIRDFLRMETVGPIILLGIAVFGSLVLPINTAFLQGLQKFRSLGFVSGALGPIKFVSCVVLVMMGLRLNGIFAGLILTNIAVFFISYMPLRSIMGSTISSEWKRNDLLSYAVPVFVANLSFAVLTQVDLLFVRHYFPPGEVGVYASAAVLGRAIMYLPASLILALFPMVAEAEAKNQSAAHLLVKASGYTMALAGTGTFIYGFFPTPVITVLFGEKYIHAEAILGLYGLAMLPMGLLLILINYNLARAKVRFVNYLLALGIAQICLILIFHESFTQILWIVFGCGTASVLIVAFHALLEDHPTIAQMRRFVSRICAGR